MVEKFREKSTPCPRRLDGARSPAVKKSCVDGKPKRTKGIANSSTHALPSQSLICRVKQYLSRITADAGPLNSQPSPLNFCRYCSYVQYLPEHRPAPRISGKNFFTTFAPSAPKAPSGRNIYSPGSGRRPPPWVSGPQTKFPLLRFGGEGKGRGGIPSDPHVDILVAPNPILM
jgi:hypothetical protein